MTNTPIVFDYAAIRKGMVEKGLIDDRAYVAAIEKNGVEIEKVEYFDRDARIAAIQNGEV